MRAFHWYQIDDLERRNGRYFASEYFIKFGSLQGQLHHRGRPTF